MGRTLAAGTSVVCFVLALILFALNGDRFAAFAALAGLTALSISVLVQVSDTRRR